MLFTFLSHVIGDNSPIVPIINTILGVGLGVMLGVLSVGYIAVFLLAVIPFMPMFMATFIASMIVACTLPFEYMEIRAQNQKSNIEIERWEFPMTTQVLMLASSILGGVQYMVRNYNMLKLFVETRSGVAFVSMLNQYGFLMLATHFVALGSFMALGYHVMTAYSNWDKYTAFNNEDYRYKVFNLLWVIGFAMCLRMLTPTIWPLLKVAALVLVVKQVFEIMAPLLPISRLKVELIQYCDQKWEEYSWLMLPIGALPYGLVDFYTAYGVMNALSITSPVMLSLCLVLGVISYFNKIYIWGYSTIRFQYSGAPVTGTFVDYYYVDKDVRRILVYAREVLLFGLDLLNNRLYLAIFSQVMFGLFGIHVGLMTLNFCSLSYALNKIVIGKLLSGVDVTEYVPSYVKEASGNTVPARFAKATFALADGNRGEAFHHMESALAAVGAK